MAAYRCQMSFSVRPHPWWTPIGLLAVIGPSMKLNAGPPRLRSRSVSNVRSLSHRPSVECSSATWSGFAGTGWKVGIRGILCRVRLRPAQRLPASRLTRTSFRHELVNLVLVQILVERGVLRQVARQLGEPELEPFRQPA